VDLVDGLPPVPEDGELRVIWKGDSETECVGVCKELQKANIAYKVAQTPESLDLRMAMNRRFEVAVRSEGYEKARQVVGEEEDWEDQDQEGQTPTENSTTPTASNDSAYLKTWYLQDASVEIWAQSATDNISSMLELSLKENLIRFRSEQQPDGLRKFFVLPKDEYIAREIVREIEESTPPR
jgi:acylphosphatase